MARITVEDCLDKIDNRFQLVLVATKRARQLSRGFEPRVPWENDKPTVVALREIADELVGAEILDQKETPVSDEAEPVEAGLDLTAELAAEFARAGVAEDEDGAEAGEGTDDATGPEADKGENEDKED